VPPLQDWRVVYVGSAKAKAFDQVLDSVLVGPVKCGVSRFELEVPGPKYAEIPPDDLLGSTAVMLSCFYREKEFVRVGYWVSNVYNKALAEGEEPPKAPPQEDISRSVLKEKPCVTRWPIEWT
jgi:histone chaperone ASF1